MHRLTRRSWQLWQLSRSSTTASTVASSPSLWNIGTCWASLLLTARCHRSCILPWSIFLSAYRYSLHYCPGKTMCPTDTFSHLLFLASETNPAPLSCSWSHSQNLHPMPQTLPHTWPKTASFPYPQLGMEGVAYWPHGHRIHCMHLLPACIFSPQGPLFNRKDVMILLFCLQSKVK